MRTRRSTTIGAAALILALAACTGGVGGADDPGAPAATAAQVIAEVAALGLEGEALDAHLLERALAEGDGPLLHYGGIEVAVLEAWSAGFAAAHPGLSHGAVRLSSSEIAERVRLEADAGARTPDILDASDVAFALLLREDRVLPHLGTIVPDGIPATAVDAHGVTFSLLPLVLAWNTDLVASEAAPRHWDDLLRPEHRGCGMADGPTFLAGLMDADGADVAEAWFDGFLANGGRIMGGSTATVTALAAGEIACMPGATLATVEELRDEGAPIEWTAPDPTPVLTYRLAIGAGTQRPYAALLFARWALGPEGAAALTANDRLSTRPDSPGADPRAQDFARPGTPLGDVVHIVDPGRAAGTADRALALLDARTGPDADR